MKARTISEFLAPYYKSNADNRSKYIAASYVLCSMMIERCEKHDIVMPPGADRVYLALSMAEDAMHGHVVGFKTALPVRDGLEDMFRENSSEEGGFLHCCSSVYNLFKYTHHMTGYAGLSMLRQTCIEMQDLLNELGYREVVNGVPESTAIVLNILSDHLS